MTAVGWLALGLPGSSGSCRHPRAAYSQHRRSRGSADFGYTIPLPGKAPVALANDTANFAPDTSGATPEDDPACTGTPSVPTAPPGRFCAYLDGTPVNLDLIRIVPMVSNLRDTGVRVVFDANAAGDAFLNFTWAYTAP